MTTLPFKGKEFDVVVANPPYGIPWKGYEKEIRNDQTGQFAFLPSVSDGQLLFLQHNAWQLHENSGLVVEVNMAVPFSAVTRVVVKAIFASTF